MEDYTFSSTKIVEDSTGYEVMMQWEYPIMQKKAEWVCQNGGDIIEFGFGMGISATLIQEQNINSHTICEIHPQVLERLHEWAKDKPNVIILEGDWYDNINQMETYDGILFDTFKDNKVRYLPQLLPQIANRGCAMTWWNNLPEEYDEFNFEKVEFEIIDVNPPPNMYFMANQYYMPKYIYK